MKFRDVFSQPVFNISNSLSLVRIGIIPFFYYYSGRYVKQPTLENLGALIGLLILGVLSDFFDGYFARLLDQVTMLGQYLDPVCDKIATLALLYLLVLDYNFPLWILSALFIRELLGVWLGSYLYFKRDIQGKPNQWGKWGVGVLAMLGFWYICLPLLVKNFEPDHWILRPEWMGYLLVFLLLGGIFAYSYKYWNIVFHPEKVKRGDYLD
jgi:CDP-diacylglycerol--glycerol-3-phosphate 3-phosphatidyltransferase